jgi:hypothetical protein
VALSTPRSNLSSSSRSFQIVSRAVWTAMLLATSPAACPPIPSATMNSPMPSSTRKLSSFASRTRPTSVLGQKRIACSRCIWST